MQFACIVTQKADISLALVLLRRSQHQLATTGHTVRPGIARWMTCVSWCTFATRLRCRGKRRDSPRMYGEPNEAGIRVGGHRTARVMRVNGLKARQKARCKRTTERVSMQSPGCQCAQSGLSL